MKTPKIEVIRDDPAIRAEYGEIQARKRDIKARLRVVDKEIGQAKLNAGAMVAEGCDHKEYTDRLADLRAEAEAIKAGIDYLDNQAQVIKRQNTWLTF